MGAKHIVLIISSLGGGGAERVIVDLGGHFADRGRHVTLVTLDGESQDAYLLSPNIGRIRLNIMWRSTHLWNRSGDALRRLLMIRHAVCALKPDAVISFVDMTNVRVLLALGGTGIRVVVSERVDPSRHSIGWFWSSLRRLTYPFADAVVVQTENAARWARKFLQASRVVVIPNSVRKSDSFEPRLRPPRMSNSSVIIAMGRLVPQKGFDLLIRAFASIAQECPGWQLVILGEGPDRTSLEALADSLGVADRISFPGTQPSPAAWLQNASLFVLSSRFEGFPNALLEAMQCGLPAVAFDCLSGPSEIIRNGVDGFLVPPENISALAQAISNIARDAEMRFQFALRASEVADRFPSGKIYENWLALCDRLS